MSSQADCNNTTISVESKQDASHDIWKIIDLDEILPDVVTAWPGISAKVVREKFFLIHDLTDGPMLIVFACFVEKDLPNISLPRRLDRTERYMSTPMIECHKKLR